MKNSEFRIKIAILATAIAFVVLFGTYKLYTIYNIEKPLVNSIQNIPEVKKITLDKKEQGQYEINIRLAKIENIQEKYQQIDNLTAKKLKADSYEIKIEDNRNAKLRQFYHYAQLALFQASDKNQYLWLNQTLQKKARDTGISCSLIVDRQRVYIEANDGEYFMYIIMPHLSNETAPEGERIS
jgi:phage-related protein